ncbi:MAG: PQQ-dependent sugar dehydrogenase, partial [Anaerolineales bacterium]
MRKLIVPALALAIISCTPQSSPRVVPTSTPPDQSPPTQPAQAEPTQAESATLAAVTVFPDPASAQWQLVAQGFNRPLFVAHAGDQRLFVVEQPGRILVISQGALLDAPLLDISDRVRDSGNEQGLLGLAFDPAFDQNGYFY